MGAPELPDFDLDDVRPTQIINQEVSSDESENEILLNTYYYQPLPFEDNGEISQSENHVLEHSANYDDLPTITNTSICMDNTSIELPDNNEESIHVETDDSNLPTIVRADVELECDVWNQPRPQELQIELDSNKTQQILNAMANFTLSNVTIPEWAVGVAEEHWKELLLQRISQRKSDEHSDNITQINNTVKDGPT